MAIWDYEGKLESVGWTRAHSFSILRARLSAPPAKMLRYFAQTVCDALLLRLQPSHLLALDVDRSKGLAGFTHDVPFLPLEDKVTTRVAAAQADDAEVNLTAWSYP
jgi:hypothetical protein